MRTLGSRLAIAVLACVALAAIGAWWWTTYQRVERWVDLPSRGEASYNPLYALKLALQADGVQVNSRQRLRIGEIRLAARDTVLILNDPRTLSQEEAHALLAWVANGGHLIMRIQPFEGRFGPPVVTGSLSRALPLQPLLLAPDCMTLNVKGEKDLKEFCGGARFQLRDEVPLASWGNQQTGFVFARLAHGQGSIDLLSDLHFVKNTTLRKPAHFALARQLLEPNYRAGTVHLVYAASMPPLWRWLLEHAWMAIVPLLLTVLAWLWMRAQRFGPQLPSPPEDRRSLLEHVQASGEHLYRYGRAHMLHTAVRNAFLARLRLRDPLAAALDGPQQAAAIATHVGIPASDVAAALQTPRPLDAADFRARIAKLIELRNRL